MSRNLSPDFIEQLERPASDAVPLWFGTIIYDPLKDPIRVCSDNLQVAGEAGKYILNGETYICCPFKWVRLTDSEGFPRANIEIQNVDREIGLTIKGITESPRFDIALTDLSEFDETVHPRVPLDTPYIEYSATHLRLTNVKVDDLVISAEIVSWDYAQEPYPSRRASISLLPGLYR